MQTISFTNKSALNDNPDIPDINKCKESDLNEIKSVVNANAIETDTRLTKLGKYSSTEVNTGKRWYNNKPIYSITFYFNTLISPNSVFTMAHNIQNIEHIWLDISNTFIENTINNICYPMPMTNYQTYTNNETLTPYVDDTNLGIISVGGWGTEWLKVMTVNYTKTTD
jgi:hypothetical protein